MKSSKMTTKNFNQWIFFVQVLMSSNSTIHDRERQSIGREFCSRCQGLPSSIRIDLQTNDSQLNWNVAWNYDEKSFSLRWKWNFWLLFTKSQWNDKDITCHRLLWVTDSYYPIHSLTELTNIILLLKRTKSCHSILMFYFSKPQPKRTTGFLFLF